MVCFFSALGILWAVYVHLEWHCSSSRWEEQDQWCRGVSPFLIDTNCYSITQNLDYPDWLVAFEWCNQCLKAPSLWGYGGPTVRVRYSAWFFFFQFLYHCGRSSLADNGKHLLVLSIIIIFKACTRGYVVNSCLAPPLNPDSEAVSHLATCSTNFL